MSSQPEPFDLRWLRAIVTRPPVAVCSNVWIRAGRLRVSMNRESTDESSTLNGPTGVTAALRYTSAVLMASPPIVPVST